MLTLFQDEGPLELTRRTKVLVWSDEVEIPEETFQDAPNEPASPKASISSVPVPRRARSQSYGSEFPPPMRRSSTDASGAPRPVPFAAKFQRVHPGTTGVTVLEHLERLDAVEASLQRLGGGEAEDEEEEDVGDMAKQKRKTASTSDVSTVQTMRPTSPFSPPGSPLPTLQEVSPEGSSPRSSVDEQDLVTLSKSASHVEGVSIFGPSGSFSTSGIEWIQNGDSPSRRTVIVEVHNCSLYRPIYFIN